MVDNAHALPEEDGLFQFLPRMYRATALMTVLGTIGFRLLEADHLAINFFIGSMISLLTMYTTEKFVKRYLIPSDQPKIGRRKLIMMMMAKIPILLIALLFVTSNDWFHPFGLTIGLAMMPTVLTVYGCKLLLSMNTSNKRIGWMSLFDATKR